ncbi:MAG: hypothetical protein ACJAQT_004753 [Akkermansiaceae bacterium]|jgi:hypothetical protein
MFFGYNAVRSYLRSDDFRVMLGSQAGGLLDGEAQFTPFVWDGWSVTTEEFSFQGKDGIQDLHARGIDAQVDIGAVWGGTYRIEEVRLREVELIGDFRKKRVDEVSEPEVIPVDGGSGGAGSGSFWDRFLPDTLEVTGIDVATVNGRAVTDDGIWAWRDMTAKIRPGTAKKVYDVELTGGDITTPLSLVDQLSLKTAKGRYSGDHFYLLSSEFNALEDARVTMSGDFGMESRAWSMDGGVKGARVEEVIAEDWKQRLMGPLQLTFSVTGQPDFDARITGKIKIKNGVLTALPVLDRIAAYSNTARFRRLALSEAELDFEKVGSSLELTNIILASEGLVRLEGSMRLDGDIIRKGNFRVGITPGTLAHIPGAETKVFQRGELGLLWTPMVISGTLDSPSEDLSERLIAAAGERMFELVPETGRYALKYSGQVVGESTKAILENQGVILGVGNELIDQAGRLIETEIGVNPVDIIEKGTGTIEEGMGKLFDLFERPIEKQD